MCVANVLCVPGQFINRIPPVKCYGLESSLYISYVEKLTYTGEPCELRHSLYSLH